MKTDLFDFELPAERIALRPCVPRDSSRLLVVDPNSQLGLSNAGLSVGSALGPLADRKFSDLADILKPTDVLVFNDTRVIASALSGVRARDDLRANVSINLLKRLDSCTWQVLAKPAKKLRDGDTIRFGNINLTGSTEQLSASVMEKGEAGSVSLKFNVVGADLDKAISVLGLMPIPPYISSKRDADAKDFETYQTIFAQVDGAVAAPTAGLHFTQDMLNALDARGIERHTLTLHVGAGTFLPVKSDDTDDHDMHSEWGTVSAATARALNEARSNGRRIIAVGTTSARLLETAVRSEGDIGSFEGDTAIFIQPGYTFRAVDGLITNFHLPRSTLFMLVSALCGLDAMKAAYAHAISQGYRFYSYGDANLLFRKSSE